MCKAIFLLQAIKKREALIALGSHQGRGGGGSSFLRPQYPTAVALHKRSPSVHLPGDEADGGRGAAIADFIFSLPGVAGWLLAVEDLLCV